ncbi:MFS transporter [Clostridium sp. HV4-5-A1G]|uniref:MFS transporter n=1 Tax=Clostridium sp. HV4-5-A1G TaxID=2004595 RepID=UPI0012388A0C|nr:MFS transporter [Clostridium sp. HV4-5-A1G]KAA8670811.1 MFS transporter [Clostridium sp. HV4-5-A1G]
MKTVYSKKITNERWIHILPPCIIIYIVAFIDRTNIGLAIAGGMDKTLAINSSVAGLAAGIFSIGYLILQVPGGNIAEHGSAKKFIALSIVMWSVLSIVNGFVNNSFELLVVRFLLGVAEGGVYPAILVLITHWFPDEERGRATGWFNMNYPIANIIASPISGWIMSIYSWRWVFIIEGILSFALLFIWYPLINNYPSDAKWIKKDELDWLENKLSNEKSQVERNISIQKTSNNIFTSTNLWLLVITYFCYMTGIFGYYLWLPTLIKDLTHTGIAVVGLLSIIPYIGSAMGIWFFSRLSDRTLKRKLYAVIPMVGLAASLSLSVVFKFNMWLSYIFLVFGGVFVQSYNSSFWAIPPMIFKADVAGAARGIINGMGNLGAFLGPYLLGLIMTYMKSADVGMYILAVILLIGCFFNSIVKLPKKERVVESS